MNFKNKTFQPLNYGDFGYPTLLHLIPSAIEDNILRDAVDQHKDALVSFITKSQITTTKKW
nr:hypothetical protein [uncultured Pseudogulbenkiania sp.]